MPLFKNLVKNLNIPSIGTQIDPEIRKILVPVREAITALEKVAVANDLYEAVGRGNGDGEGGMPPLRPRPGSDLPIIPTVPQNVEGSGTVTSAILTWDMPEYYGHATTEVWRAEEDSIGLAEMVGSSNGLVHVDYVGAAGDTLREGETGAVGTRYYWVRHVGKNGTKGPFHAQRGLRVTPGYIEGKQLAELSVDTLHVVDAAIKTAKIDDLAVTNAKIQNLSAAKIDTDFLSADRIAVNSLHADKLLANTIETKHIKADGIHADRLVARTITADRVTINGINAPVYAVVPEANVTNLFTQDWSPGTAWGSTTISAATGLLHVNLSLRFDVEISAPLDGIGHLYCEVHLWADNYTAPSGVNDFHEIAYLEIHDIHNIGDQSLGLACNLSGTLDLRRSTIYNAANPGTHTWGLYTVPRVIVWRAGQAGTGFYKNITGVFGIEHRWEITHVQV